jgi:hypothetical protein
MKQDTNRKIKVEATTGEVYIEYMPKPRHKMSTLLQRIGSFLAAPVRAHFARLDTLRVYDHRRIDN